MLRTSWSSLATTAFRSLVQRVSLRSGFSLPARSRRRRGNDCFGSINVAAEVLEVRDMLMAPMTFSDSYSVAHDHTLNASSVLSNDTNMGMGTMTAVQYSSPSHGTISAFNSNGTFTYVPTTHFAGSDSFQYEAHNDDGYSSPTTISLTVSNTAPTATNDSYTIYKDSVTISSGSGLLANDSDIDGDTLTGS